MVSVTVQFKNLITINYKYEFTKENGEFYVFFHPDKDTKVKIKLDMASVITLRENRTEMNRILDNYISLSGVIAEKWQRQLVKKTITEEEWVKVE